jgi:hypothetical protein
MNRDQTGTGAGSGRRKAAARLVWFPEQVTILRGMVRAGFKDDAIALMLGRTERAVNGKRFRLGLAPKRRFERPRKADRVGVSGGSE